MAKQTRKNLEDRAGVVETELQTGANTATRIGQLLRDILDSAPIEYDNSRAYVVGDLALWQNRIVECFQATTAGQSPATHPVKWKDNVVSSTAQFGQGGSNYPVLAQAVADYVTQRINEVDAGSGVAFPGKATEQLVSEGTNDATYITPFLLKKKTDSILDVFDNFADGLALEALGNDATPGSLNAFFLRMLNLADETTLAKLCELNSNCGGSGTPTGSFTFTSQFVAIMTEDSPLYKVRLDVNNCAEIRLWAADLNHTGQAVTITITCDGDVIFSGPTNVARPDVRLALIAEGKQAESSAFDLYGLTYTKPAKYSDGKQHTFRVYAGSVEAISDVGALNTITCGTPAPTPKGIYRIDPNSPAAVNEAAYGFYELEEQLSDDSWILYNGPRTWPNNSFPTGTSIDQTGLLSVGANTISSNQNIVVRAVIAGVNVDYAVTLINGAPVATGYHIEGPNSVTEGTTAGPYSVVQDFSDNSTQPYTAGGAYSLAPSMSGLQIANLANAEANIVLALDSITANTALTLRFTFPNNSVISKPVQAVNVPNSVNHDPVREIATGFLTSFQNVAASTQFPANQFSDPDGDPLTWGLEYGGTEGSEFTSVLPSWASFTVSTRTFTRTVPTVGQTYWRKKVSDGRGGVAYDPFFINTTVAP